MKISRKPPLVLFPFSLAIFLAFILALLLLQDHDPSLLGISSTRIIIYSIFNSVILAIIANSQSPCPCYEMEQGEYSSPCTYFVYDRDIEQGEERKSTKTFNEMEVGSDYESNISDSEDDDYNGSDGYDEDDEEEDDDDDGKYGLFGWEEDDDDDEEEEEDDDDDDGKYGLFGWEEDDDDDEEEENDYNGSDGYDEADEEEDGDDDDGKYGLFGWEDDEEEEKEEGEDEEEEEYDPDLQERTEAFIAKVIEGWRQEWFRDHMHT